MYTKHGKSWYLVESEPLELSALLDTELRKHYSTGETEALVFRTYSVDSSFEYRVRFRFGWSGMLMTFIHHNLKADKMFDWSCSQKLPFNQESVFKIVAVLEFFGIEELELIEVIPGTPKDAF